jgi:hypothetical protein
VYKIIEGNDRADKLAGAAKGDKGNKFKLYEGSDRFRVLTKSREPVRGNILKKVRETLKENRNESWIANSSNKYLAAARLQPDTLMASLWPLQEKDCINKALSTIRNFKHKLISGQLPTRKLEHIIAKSRNFKIDKKPQKWNDLYKIKYESSNCFYCEQKDIMVEESRDHIFNECQHSKRQEYYDIAAKRILMEVNKHVSIPLDTLDWWFHVSSVDMISEQDFGCMGVIPSKYRKQLLDANIPNKTCQDIIMTTSMILCESIQETWKKRCKDFDEWAKNKYQAMYNKPFNTKRPNSQKRKKRQYKKKYNKRKTNNLDQQNKRRKTSRQNYDTPIT